MTKKKLMSRDKINARAWWIFSTVVLIVFVGIIFIWNLFVLPKLLEFYMVPHIDERKTELLQEINGVLEATDDIDYEEFEIIEEDYSVIIDIRDADKVVYNTFSHNNKGNRTIDIDFKEEERDGLIDRITERYATKHGIKKGTIQIEINGAKRNWSKSQEQPIYVLYEYKSTDSAFAALKGKNVSIYYDTHSYSAILKKSNASRIATNSAIMFVLWLFFSIVISGYQSKIIKINMAVKRVWPSGFKERCPEGPSDVGRLGAHVNNLLDALQLEKEKMGEENRKLQKKIDSAVRVEDDKKDFLANTAHELKTPISIIRGCAEGLKFGIAKGGRARQKYCDTIIDESEKMNKLVLELLELSKYKQKMYENVVEENFSIRSFVQGNLNSMEAVFKENGITVENTINRSYIGRTDIEKQDLVLRNYIKNAISHVDMYKKIVISCEEKPHSYRISVFNSGEKISEEDKNKIWDSFYRVDKSHSRTEGRFGIGLQIVASIQSVLKMDYGVRNVHGGVQFWFDVKKAAEADK